MSYAELAERAAEEIRVRGDLPTAGTAFCEKNVHGVELGGDLDPDDLEGRLFKSDEGSYFYSEAEVG